MSALEKLRQNNAGHWPKVALVVAATSDPAERIHYSRGDSKFDNLPEQREAENFDAFAAAVLADRAPVKGLFYVCAPFAEGAHTDSAKHPEMATWRQAHLALPRAFLPFDFDGFQTPLDWGNLLKWLHRFKGFAYTTASHTPDAPRCRVVLALTRATTRDEGKTLGEEIEAQIARDLGPGRVVFDRTVYRAEQPLFTPLLSSQVFRFDGRPVDVDTYLDEATPAPVATATPKAAPTAPVALDTLRDAVMAIPNGPEQNGADRDWWFVRLCSIKEAGGDEAQDLAREWSIQHGDHDDAKFDKAWNSITVGKKNGAPADLVLALAEREGWHGRTLEQFDHVEDVSDLIGDVPAPAAKAESPLHGFYAYLPAHQYLHRPTRAFWPAASVDGNFPIKIDKLKASQWLDKHRAVQQATWHPGYGEVIHDAIVVDGGFVPKAGMMVYNRYRAPTLVSGNANNAARWRDHLRAIYPGEADHIEHWLAHRLQRPAEKINHALVLGGAQGIGKDSILEPAKRGVGGWNWKEIEPKRLAGQFNPWVEAVVLRINEGRDLGDTDRFAFYDHSKTYIAAPPDVLTCNDKHAKEYPVFNVMGVIITTNHKTNGIYLPMDDRRHFVAWSEATKEDFTEQYWIDFWAWLDAGGDADVAAYLRELDLRDFNPKATPRKTEAFFAIVQAGANPDDIALASVLVDAAGSRLPAVTLDKVVAAAAKAEEDDLAQALHDPRNRRRVPHMMERAGYASLRNPDAKDGLWKIGKRRQVVYADSSLSVAVRFEHARRLAGGDQ